MPSDAQKPRIRKPEKSGAQKRREAHEREEAAFASPGIPDEWRQRYEQIGAPPGDVVGRIEWANKIGALLIYEQLAAPEIRSPQERRLVLEGIRTLGMTAVKALYEQRLKRVEATLYGGAAREELDEVDGLEPDPTAGPAS